MPIGSNFKKYSAKGNSTFRKTEFIDLSQGKHIVRFLNTEEVVYMTHFVKGVTFACPGEDCPICENNKKMFMEHGKEAWKVPGFVSRRAVGYINLLDKTPVKICPGCQTEVKKNISVFPTTCPKCGGSLVGVQAEPLNKVKVLSKGVKVFEQIAFHDKAVIDEATETPIGFTNYDFEIMVMAPKGDKTAPVLNALPKENAPVEVKEEALFDLDKAILKLDPDEIKELLRGVRLPDIFAARRATAPTASSEATEEMRDEMSSLFES